MCGIAGFVDRSGRTSESDGLRIGRAMAGTLAHRGPDADGVWCDPAAGAILGHRRLSILDLTEAGCQPMRSPCGRWTLVYNGEVYNHLEMRPELEARGFLFRGHSDTETLLAAIAAWGVKRTVERSNGMFAFAAWDSRERRLTLVRDRLGIKPLYYGRSGDTVLFASELKALRAHPEFRGEVDREAVSLLLRYGYVPGPRSIYRGVFKLPPGTMIEVSGSPGAALPTPEPFWSLDAVVERGRAEPFRGTESEATDRLEELLTDAVRLRLLSDVPVGAFLSGGIDSSLVVALMRRLHGRPVKTFTIGFTEAKFDESKHGRAIAEHLGTDHTEMIVTPSETRDVIPRLPEMYDEPFADESQIPTFLVSELARRHVTVSLSGDGGDEVFGGYGRYFDAAAEWRTLARVPVPVRRAAAQARRTLPYLPPWVRLRLQYRLARLDVPGPNEIYVRRFRHWHDLAEVVIGGGPATDPIEEACFRRRGLDIQSHWMYADTLTYLPDDILVKVDRASMAVGLEARVPLLDYRVVGFAWSLPAAFKIRGGLGKRPLREVLARHVPRPLFERPKMGFGIPVDEWLRGPLRDWAESLLDESRLREQGFLRPEPIREKWEQHQAGTGNWHQHLWNVLMFQAWLERESAAVPPRPVPVAVGEP